MAASGADLRSILSLTPSLSLDKKATATPTVRKSHKPEGISREVYALIGPSTPSIAAQLSLAPPQLKQKPNLGGGGKIKWQWRAFKNGARTDNLQLRHWVKAKSDHNVEYPFAKYNVPLTAYTYSQDDYTRFLSDEDWTKDETDYLFALVQEYDLRWYIIHDRYEFAGGKQRTLEDLKDRYCSVCRKLIRNRPWAGDESSKASVLASFSFDKEREATRKLYVHSLEGRTPEQIEHEEALYVQLKRLEQTERRFKREREDLLRLTAGIDSGLADVIEDDLSASMGGVGIGGIPSSASATMAGEPKKKRIGRGASIMATDTEPSTPVNTISLTPTAPKIPPQPPKPSDDAKHCIVRTDSRAPTTKSTSTAAYLRSSRIPVPKAINAQKITQALDELGVSYTRLVMPTRENCLQLEALLEATTALVETKKTVDRVDIELQVARERLRVRESGETGRESSLFADHEGTEGGDIDGEGEVEDGRAQSVLSTRSTRSRKHARRSVSVSSVDTNATAPRPPKRQKRS